MEFLAEGTGLSGRKVVGRQRVEDVLEEAQLESNLWEFFSQVPSIDRGLEPPPSPAVSSATCLLPPVLFCPR